MEVNLLDYIWLNISLVYEGVNTGVLSFLASRHWYCLTYLDYEPMKEKREQELENRPKDGLQVNLKQQYPAMSW